MAHETPEIPGTGVIIAIFTGIVGLAMISVIISQNSQTAQILQALGASASQVLNTAVSPVMGGGRRNSFGLY
ncbi:MAG: hypothetical protein ACREBU_03225 [Nitrososphaera sp.]